MSERIALRCPHCQKISYRPVGFVRARSHFMCKYCHKVGKINPDDVSRAPTRHQKIVEVDADALKLVSDTTAEKHDT